MADIKLKAVTGTTVVSSGSAVAAGARSAASGTAWANQTDLAIFADVELVATFGVAPTVGRRVQVYAIPALDATNYMDGSDTVLPSANLLVGWAFVRAVTTAQRLQIRRGPGEPPMQFGPYPYKFILDNQADQQISAGWALKVMPVMLQSV